MLHQPHHPHDHGSIDVEPSRPLRATEPDMRSSVYELAPAPGGRMQLDTTLTRAATLLRERFATPAMRIERRLDDALDQPRKVSRCNVVGVVSPKGGVGKTTTSFVLGNVLAARLKLRVVVIDANPDFGTLGALAPDTRRTTRTLADLLDALDDVTSAATLSGFVSRLESGLHLLAAPQDADVMQQLGAERYAQLLDFLGRYYDVIVLDLGTGITSQLAQFATRRSDQLVLVTTPEWVTSRTVLSALGHLTHEHTTLVLNQARAARTLDSHVIDACFRSTQIVERITIPYDLKLRTMLDSGTYDLASLPRTTRSSIKQLAVATTNQLS